MKDRTVFVLVFSLVLSSRLPFLNAGYGTDPDAWRVASSAKYIATTGEYRASRLPGYPFQEYVYSLFTPKPWVYNALTALFSALASAFFALELKYLGLKDHILGGTALACIPVVFINSVNAMDYMWAMCFLLASWWAISKSSTILAGILIGLAMGCRITSVLALAPFVLYVIVRDRERGFAQSARIVSVAVIVSVALYFPVVKRYGAQFLTFYEHGSPGVFGIVSKLTLEMWGPIGAVLILALTLWVYVDSFTEKNSRQNPALTVSAADRMLLISSLFVFLLPFARLPYEAGYLIPAIPFFITLGGAVLTRLRFRLLCVEFIASSLFVSVDSFDRPWSPQPSYFSFSVQANGRVIALDVLLGPIFKDWQRRQQRMRFLERILKKADTVTTRCVVVSGVWLTQIVLADGGLLPDNEEEDYSYRRKEVIFVGLLDSLSLERYKLLGTPIYFVPSQDRYNLDVFGVDLRKEGASEFPGL